MSGWRRVLIGSLAVVANVLGGTAVWSQEGGSAADAVAPYPAAPLEEPADYSTHVVPYPAQPTVSIGGPFGVVTGGRFGLRIGGPNGVHIGGGRGVQIGPPANGAPLTRIDSSDGLIAMGNQVTLRHPESASHDLQVRINGSDVVISPGETIQVDGTEPVVIRVPKRKGGWGFPRGLAAGHYVFGETARGWRVFREDPALVPTSANEQNPRPDGPLDLQPPMIESGSDPTPATGSPPSDEPPAEEIPRPKARLELPPPPVIETP